MNTLPTPASSDVTAACGAYLLAVFADARVEEIEEARFLDGVVNHKSFIPFGPKALADEYTRLFAALSADFGAAKEEILTAIAEHKSNPDIVEAVKTAVRQAVVADQAIKPQEENILSAVARALGLGPGAL
ncbi:MAG: tellurite resistance TerB family protein [Parvularculaceae bacterium]|nr:tellurite resistance TerB family protein [Parvularculaceae bacterium]